MRHGGQLRGLEAVQAKNGQLTGRLHGSDRLPAVAQQWREPPLHTLRLGLGTQTEQDRPRRFAQIMSSVILARPLRGLLQELRIERHLLPHNSKIGHAALAQSRDGALRQRGALGKKKPTSAVRDVSSQNFAGKDLLDALVHDVHSIERRQPENNS